MKNNLVSIIIPIYNGQKYLYKTIKSCLIQTYENIEIILIDDCSTDNSYNVLEEFLKNDNVFYYKNKKNSGVLNSCNNAVTKCSGEYILLLGQDDILKKSHIEKMINSFNDNTSIVFCNAITIDSYDNEMYKLKDDELLREYCKNCNYHLAKENFIPSTGLIISKEMFKTVGGFDESFRNYGEWLLWIKLSVVGEVVFNDNINSLYRRHESNMTNSFSNIDVEKKLNNYFKKCRLYSLKNVEMSLKNKIKTFMYFVYKSFRFNTKYIFKKLVQYKN